VITSQPKIVLCNGAESPNRPEADSKGSLLRLNYLPGTEQNVNINLPNFVRNVYYLPNRILDLLEIAAYVFAADRLVRRGAKDAVEYHSWARSFEFVVRVRDIKFWEKPTVGQALSKALQFMTGDRQYKFLFQAGHSTLRTSLFDREEFQLTPPNGLSILLFSGGLDSLSGALERLQETDDHVCLISHQSQPGTKRTQESLFRDLKKHYPGRVFHYRFNCTLRGQRAEEETQRTRAFLYTCIAFAIACAFSQDRILVYENGIASINFERREDLSNARASRTTHPLTIRRLEDFFSLFVDHPARIMVPFFWKTKTEIFEYLRASEHPEMISSAVSCGRTFQNLGQATHCGGCIQCIDRRIAAYAAESDDLDESGIYATDIIAESIDSGETKTMLMDYLRQARRFASWNIDHFYKKRLSDLIKLTGCVPGCKDERDLVERVYDLCRRHGKQVQKALLRMRDIYDDPYQDLNKDSLLQLVAVREHLKEPIERLVLAIEKTVSDAVPKMFRRYPPVDEPDLNAKINPLIEQYREDLRSEYPVVTFACARVVPDHALTTTDLLIESKYIRKGTPPSKASEGIAADLTKFPADVHILFLVYDPLRAIPDDKIFKEDFESKGRCTICILR